MVNDFKSGDIIVKQLNKNSNKQKDGVYCLNFGEEDQMDNYHKNKTYFIKSMKILENKNSSDLKDTRKPLRYRLCNGETKESQNIRTFRCKKLTYIWDDEKSKFVKLAGLQNGVSTSELHRFKGYNKEDQNRQKIIYGSNEINIPIQSIPELLILEALTPFYIFQLFSLIVWLCESYYYYGVAIVIMSVFGVASSVIQTRKNQQNLKGTVHTSDQALVRREDGLIEEVPASDLVPGDVIIIPKYGCEMQCDAVLLIGSCIVNESMLTGESVPVTKTPLPNNNILYSVKEDVNHTLFCGTKVIQTRGQEDDLLKAVVIRTGYLTIKGELVRSILYPPPADFKFDRDSYKYIIILSIIATLGFLWTIASKATRNIAVTEIIVKALDIFTICIPPALPAAMTVGKLYALNRLKDHNIFCINSRVINVSGSVDCVCFDKTGTLTEDELDLWAVVPIKNGHVEDPVRDVTQLSTDSRLFKGMTSCHTLTIIEGDVCGDPLDVKMFESTSWLIEETDNFKPDIKGLKPLMTIKSPPTNEKIKILKQFQFSSNLQRMSVIISKNNCLEIYCKGSPEKIISLSNKPSIPDDIYDKLSFFTQQGYRVIAMGAKEINDKDIDLENIHRDEIEKDLDFVGLIVLENKLKPQTNNVIKVLKEADMKIVMITGDNIETAITVAKECQIIEDDATVIEIKTTKPTKMDFAGIQYSVLANKNDATKVLHEKNFDIEKCYEKNFCFALTGQNWANINKYFPDLIPKIVTKGAVFARMSGQQKQELIEALKKLGYYVAMCGDGSNDCSALKAAHVGISLSEAEASIASPFTSKEQNISCTPKVIKEGRAALVTSFGVFKIMLCYSLTEFTSTLILYTIDSNLSSLQFLYIDLILILNFMFSFGRTKAYDRLSKKPPRTSILSFVPLSSITLFLLTAILFQVFAFMYVQTFDWFKPFVYTPDKDINYNNISFEGYSVFCVSMFQYITMTIVFSKGKPYRKSIFTNSIFLVSLFFTTLLCLYITLIPANFFASILQLMMPPLILNRFFIVWISLLNFFICYVIEEYFVQVFLEKYVAPKITKTKKLYLEVLDGLRKETNWLRLESGFENCNIIEICEKNEKHGYVNKGFVSENHSRL